MQNDKPKVLIDLDGTICNTPRMVSKWSKEMFGIGPGDVPYKESLFNIEDVWEGMNFQKMKKIFNNPEFWKSVKPFSMASNFTKQISRWAELHIVTDRRWYPELVKETEDWLKDHNISYDVLAVVRGKEKGQYCINNSISVAVEDRPENIKAIQESQVCPVIIMKWLYNECKLPNTLIASNYYQATSYIADILDKRLESWDTMQSTELLYEQ